MIIPESQPQKQFPKKKSSESRIHPDIFSIFMGPIPEISSWSMIIDQRFRWRRYLCPMRKATTGDEHEIIARKIEFLDTFFHERKTQTLFFEKLIEFLTRKIKTLRMDTIFRKMLSDIFFVIEQREDICFRIDFEKTFYHFFSTSVFYEHFMQYCNFHGFFLEKFSLGYNFFAKGEIFVML